MTTAVQRAAIELSQVREQLAELIALPEPTETDLATIDELTGRIPALEKRHRAAQMAEPDPPPPAPEPESGGGGDSLETLIEKFDFGRLLECRAFERAPEGAERELLRERKSDVMASLPLDILFREPVETRATTSGPSSNPRAETWIDRIFSPSVAAWAGSAMRSVGPGERLWHIVSAGGPSVAEKAEGATTDQTAATITSTTGSPKRVPGSYRWSVESAAESPGLEAALRRDLRGLLSAAIDQMVVDDLVAIETATDMSSQLTFALLKGLVSTEVDGKYAVDEMAVRLLCNPTVFARLMAVNPTNDDSVDGASWLRSRGGLRVSDKMPAANSGISDSVFVRTSVRSTSMVSVWADAQVVLDPYTRASQGERVLTVFSLVDHNVIDAGAYSVQGIKTTS